MSGDSRREFGAAVEANRPALERAAAAAEVEGDASSNPKSEVSPPTRKE